MIHTDTTLRDRYLEWDFTHHHFQGSVEIEAIQDPFSSQTVNIRHSACHLLNTLLTLYNYNSLRISYQVKSTDGKITNTHTLFFQNNYT